ncbi:CxxxxCH/CxxCH domain c-type cytochrome [Geotalea uraniireducens]|uniref:Cytochrome C family protein n=1 Tax=Geotalea uraniireducens (strain Rf4) TaxID=351605 RepID=A5GCI4_GEOUR|nr:CxxxxCH/CxxCH domain-containing protein [Geotalea uraniireducens]ABQ24713.1 cytochrome C family protein [Geotalea uraniireducens Rf4]
MKKKLGWGSAGKLFLFLALSFVNLCVTAGNASAALDCNGCHGTSSPTDYRPVDAGYRNITTGGIQGNHRTHMALTSNQSSCTPCHNSAGFTSSHRDGKISFQANINGSPLAATYGKGVFVNQTSNPVMTNANCSNANCHFESITPTWGSSAASTNCDTCHAAQPSTLSHPKHVTAFGGTASCIKCHPNRTTFEHATSAGNAGRNIAVTIGSYAGSNYNYLPSQSATRTAGSCSALYCHSSGQSATGGALTGGDYVTATWDSAASGACGTCHKNTAATIASGSHNKHLNAAGSAGCVDCHVGVTGDGVSYNSTRHVDTFINVTGAYSQGKASTPGNGYGTCSAAACHDNGTGTKVITPTWGNTAAACTACHALQPATGSHTKHLSTTQYTKANCASCHASAVEGSNGGTGHLDGNIDAINGYPANKTKGSAYATCNAAYCHSPGQSVTGGALTTEYATITWGGTAACGSCHNATKATIASGSHNKHLNAAGSAGCVDCHVGVTGDGVSYNSTRHVDTFINVTGAYSQGKASTPGNGYGTCSAAACHDNGTGTKVITPTWGNTAAACTACHALQPATGSHTKHLSTTQYTKANCASCHASAVEGSNGGTGHLDGNIDATNGYPANKTKGSAYATCNAAYCHSPGQSVTGGALTIEYATITWGGTAACGSCHNATKATIASGSHNKHLNAAGSAGCVDCHVGVTGDGVSYNSTRHVDTFINVTGAYSQGKASTPGNGYGTCSAAACHDNGTGTKVITPTWGNTAAACTACHALQPATGSHTKHLSTTQYTKANCASCHASAVEGSNGGTGHLDGNIDAINGYPANKTKGSAYATCNAAYCHSPGQSATGGALTTEYATVTWGDTVGCGSCHNATSATLNSGTHAKHLAVDANCANCHAGAVGNGVSYNSTNHVNSLIEVSAGAYNGAGTPGNGYGSCSTTPCHFSSTGSVTWGADTVTTSCEKCHGSANTAQPAAGGTFKSTAGATANTDVKVGAHVAHLGSNTTAGHQITVNLSCADCHKSVSSFNDANHIHAGQSVGEAGMAWSALAATGGVTPSYDPVTGNCTNYCHGATLADGTTATKQTAKWNQPLLSGAPALTNCGVCHGNPPATSGHISNPVGPVYVAQNSCNGCHSDVNTDGMTIADKTMHANGVVDGGSCNACHGYPPVKDMAGLGIQNSYTTARLQNYSGGGGAHNVPGHIALMAKATDSWSPCLICHPSASHNQGSGVFVPGNVQVSVDSKFKFDSKLPITYTGNQTGSPLSTGSCSNVSCHFKASPKWSTER